MEDTISMMQDFMIKQGFINEPMDQDDICKYIRNVNQEDNSNDNHNAKNPNQKKGRKHNEGEVGDLTNDIVNSPLEATVYKSAVKISNVVHDLSGTSDDVNNTSDESLDKGDNRMNTLDDSVNLLSHISGITSSRRS